ncbi:EamA family transporter [Alphaproteobacteria bacterium GH1-50]|uniref:EamA family transporter n=1 Tax=Kangsaoukella pontilimi TaxID=2691042 RepID=A0A7C9MGN7_9RHOB|nr:EamA family transporter [Kangsaoukella pontilimi]MXQ08476.1 EamA family transporter [Kangsaoukella pontilimi]
MSLLGLALVLAAALCHATWNVFVKKINGGPELLWLFSAVALVLYGPLALWILLVERPALGWVELGFIAGSSLIHLGYFLMLQAGYRKGNLSLVYPTARATGPLLSSLFAVLILGEVLSTQMAVGAGLIVFGVLMLSGGLRRGSGAELRTSLLFGLGTGLLIGSYTAWDAYAVSVLLVPPLLLDYATTLGRVILLAPVARRRPERVRQLWREHRGGVLVIAVFSPLAYILVLYALTFTPVTYVAPLREVSVLLTVIAGSVLLKEGHLKERLGWAVVILTGMTLLVTG